MIKEIESYGYKIGSLGTILGLKGSALRPGITEGYHMVTICGNGKRTNHFVHRLVALKWVHNPDPERLTRVNHKDGNKLNNRADNLEWIDARGNMLHYLGYEDYLR